MSAIGVSLCCVIQAITADVETSELWRGAVGRFAHGVNFAILNPQQTFKLPMPLNSPFGMNFLNLMTNSGFFQETWPIIHKMTETSFTIRPSRIVASPVFCSSLRIDTAGNYVGAFYADVIVLISPTPLINPQFQLSISLCTISTIPIVDISN